MRIPSWLRPKLQRAYSFARRNARYASLPIKRKHLSASNGLDRIDPAKPTYVFFAPEAAVSPHFVAHCIIAKTLQELGHQVLLVRCFDMYQHCLSLEMLGVPINTKGPKRAEACLICAESGQQKTTEYDLPTITLNDLLSDQDLAEIKAEIRSIPSDASLFEVDGIRFGSLCCMDIALLTKKIDQANVTGQDRQYLEGYLDAALVSYYAMKRLLQTYTVGRVLFFNEYSMLMGAVMAAQKAGIPVGRLSHAIHRNIDRTKIIMMSDLLAITNYHGCLDRWPQWRVLPLPPETVEKITDNQLSRMGASGFSVYSPKFSGTTDALAKELGLKDDKIILVAYTSSLDEYYSNIHLMSSVGVDLFQREQPFKDQIEWIDALIRYVEKSPSLQLVVRIHPREGVNTRENIASEHRDMLADKFSEYYKNCKIIWPEEKISSYDLAELADVALTSWTNITSETARLGIPTIIAFKRVNTFPVDDMVEWAPTPEEYFTLLEKTLVATPSLNSTTYAYRWSHCAFLACYVDVDDVVPHFDYSALPPFKLPRSAPIIEDFVCHGSSLQEIRFRELSTGDLVEAERAEQATLKQQLRRVIWFLITGSEPKEDYILRYGPVANCDPNEVVIEMNGKDATISIRGTVIKKKSRAIGRLSQLIAES